MNVLHFIVCGLNEEETWDVLVAEGRWTGTVTDGPQLKA
jgi:hypothetical protein